MPSTETAWNSTTLPEANEGESRVVLIRLTTGEAYTATLFAGDEDLESPARWILCGRDGYDFSLNEVLAWAELPQ